MSKRKETAAQTRPNSKKKNCVVRKRTEHGVPNPHEIAQIVGKNFHSLVYQWTNIKTTTTASCSSSSILMCLVCSVFVIDIICLICLTCGTCVFLLETSHSLTRPPVESPVGDYQRNDNESTYQYNSCTAPQVSTR
jgi:hypothetical protein